MKCCRACANYREPYEPRGPAWTRYPRGCKPASNGAVSLVPLIYPDEENDCAAFADRLVRVVDCTVPTAAELTDRHDAYRATERRQADRRRGDRRANPTP